MIRIVVVGIVWALVVLLLGIGVIRYGSERLREWIALQSRRQTSYDEEQQIGRMERHLALDGRRDDASILEATTAERIELEKAQLSRRAADERAAARIAEDLTVIQARTDEELKIIEGRAEGKAIAARDSAAKGGDAAIPKELHKGYNAYLEQGNGGSFGEWFESTDLSGVGLSVVEQLISMYIEYLEQDSDNDYGFGDWIKEVNLAQFR